MRVFLRVVDVSDVGFILDGADHPKADAHDPRDVRFAEHLNCVPLGHPFPLCRVERVSAPKGLTQSGQNFRKTGGQELRNSPQ
jgi:hypothetical protein